MNSPLTPDAILQQMAQIQRMERGSVSTIRQGPDRAYHNHQCYEQGRNVSRYVPAEQLGDLQQAIQGYRCFQQLVEQYVQLVVDRTRAERQAGAKKKPQRPICSSPRSRKSSN